MPTRKGPRLKIIDGRGPRAMKASVAKASSELAKSLELVLVPPEPVLKTIHPTASKTDLLFACSYPWERKAPRELVGNRTRFGSAFHEGMEGGLTELKIPSFSSAKIAKRWDVEASELRDRLDEALPVLRKWLGGDNLWEMNFLKVGIKTEVSVAYHPEFGFARFIDGPTDDTHEYLDVQPGEIPGTADVVAFIDGSRPSSNGKFRVAQKTILIEDHKSGWSVAADWQPHTPAENGQLRTLATAFASLYKADRAIVAFFHAPAGGLPTVYADEMGPTDFEAHRKQLAGALKRVGNGWLRPGDHCSYCPAWSICPTNTTSLTELKRSGGPLTALRVGAIHEGLAEFRRLEAKLYTEIRHWVEQHGPGERPDGSSVELVEKEVERLSKASIVRALGPIKGGKLLEQLRAMGALETKPQVELRAVKPMGR